MSRFTLRSGRLVAIAVLVLVVIGHGPSASPATLDMTTLGATTAPGGRSISGNQSSGGDQSTPGSRSGSGSAPGGADNARASKRGAGDPDRVLVISSVTPWVQADGEFQIRFAPSSKIPADAKLTYTIHQSLVASAKQSLRSKVLDLINGGPTGRVLQAPVTRPLSDYGDPTSGAVVSIPVRSSTSSDSTRAFLPNPGIHPVDLVLTTADGPELWSQVVFLNRLPRQAKTSSRTPSRSDGDGSTRPVTVSMVVPIQTDPALSADMEADFPLETRFLLDSTTELLTKARSAPLRLGLRPDTFAALTRIDEKWAQNLVAAIGGATGVESGTDNASRPGVGDGSGGTAETPSTTSPSTTTPSTTTPPNRPAGGASILRLPFSALDIGGLANSKANAGRILERQLSLGSKVVAEVTARKEASSTWVFDDTVTNESLPLIRSMNFTDVALPVSRLETTDDLHREDLMTGPVKLDGPSQLRAIAYDDVLSQQLSNPSLDPAVRAHDALALLMSSWFSANESGSELSVPTSVIVVPSTTDPEVITTLASALSADGPLQASTGSSLLPPPTDGTDEPITRLTFRPATDINETIAENLESQRQIDAVNSMSQSAEPALEIWNFLNAETFDLSLSSEERQARHDAIRSQVALKFGAIETPPPRRVVLATRQHTIPLRFRNGLPYQVQLRMRARSPRLAVRFSDSDLVVLEPGENRFDLPVEVRAPGESLLRVQLATPDGSIVLSSFDIPVRSTSISGVGSALSIISIAFLLIWWLHTMRRRRRETGRAASLHPSTAGPPPDAGTVDQSG